MSRLLIFYVQNSDGVDNNATDDDSLVLVPTYSSDVEVYCAPSDPPVAPPNPPLATERPPKRPKKKDPPPMVTAADGGESGSEESKKEKDSSSQLVRQIPFTINSGTSRHDEFPSRSPFLFYPTQNHFL